DPNPLTMKNKSGAEMNSGGFAKLEAGLAQVATGTEGSIKGLSLVRNSTDRPAVDLSYVRAAVESIGPVLRPGNRVIIESTVPPGTIEHVVLPIVERYGWTRETVLLAHAPERDRKSTRLNSSHVKISYAVFCLKKKKNISTNDAHRPKQSDLTITTNTRQHMS